MEDTAVQLVKTWADFFSTLTEEQLQQPMKYTDEEGKVWPITKVELEEDYGHESEMDNFLRSRSQFIEEEGSDDSFSVVCPKGTIYVTASKTNQ